MSKVLYVRIAEVTHDDVHLVAAIAGLSAAAVTEAMLDGALGREHRFSRVVAKAKRELRKREADRDE